MTGIDLYDIYEKYCLEVCSEREQYKPYYEGEVGCCYYCKIDSFISHVEESRIIILKPSDIKCPYMEKDKCLKITNGINIETEYCSNCCVKCKHAVEMSCFNVCRIAEVIYYPEDA